MKDSDTEVLERKRKKITIERREKDMVRTRSKEKDSVREREIKRQ